MNLAIEVMDIYRPVNSHRCCRESPIFDRFFQVPWVVKFFSQDCQPSYSKQVHPLSKAYPFDILNYSYYGKSHKILQNEILQYPIWQFFSYCSRYDLFNKHNFKMVAKRIRGDATTLNGKA